MDIKKVVIAIDSFKGSLSSMEAGKAAEAGIRRVLEGAEVKMYPIADGGEGTVDALVQGMNGTYKTSEVTGPLGNKVKATWGIIEPGKAVEKSSEEKEAKRASDEAKKTEKIAVIEMASAAGITLINREELNPLYTTTYGVGELIREAISEGCRKFIIGIGGSATNDGGAGMLQALGLNLKDSKQEPIAKGAKGLADLVEVSTENIIPELNDCEFLIACDVTNPLTGENGCSAVYGPQKGATPEMVKEMDGWLENYAKVTKGDKNYPGAGAAGGLGYAFLTFTNAKLQPGIEIVLSQTGIEEYIKEADIVVTGEGRIDSQTINGKVPIGVAKLAKKYHKPVIAFCGAATEDSNICNEHGIDGIFPILRGISTLDEALEKENAAKNLELTSEQVFNILAK